MKTCTKCRKPLTENDFPKNRGTKDGLHCWCKACKCQNDNAYAAIHREERRNYAAKYYATHQQEIQKYRATHREEMREYNVKYRAEHRAEQRQHKLKRRFAEKLNKGQSYADWERALRSKKTFVCYWCEKRKPTKKLHIDHMVPISKGGVDGISNVVPSCAHCNQTKSAKDLETWAPSVGMLAI